MSKLLILAAIVVAIWWILRKMQRPVQMPSAHERSVEVMVACAHCGVNQPRSECVEGAGHLYCSEAHRKAAVRGG